jgi:hypothetical protein
VSGNACFRATHETLSEIKEHKVKIHEHIILCFILHKCNIWFNLLGEIRRWGMSEDTVFD